MLVFLSVKTKLCIIFKDTAFRDQILAKMSLVKIGDLSEIRGELTIEWTITKFPSLSNETTQVYESPNFYFSGASWCLLLYPNGNGVENDGYISLFLLRRSFGCPYTISFTFGFITNDKKLCHFIGTKSSFKKCCAEGYPQFISRSILMEMKTELMPSDELTISCSLKSCEPNAISESLFHRLDFISHNLAEIYKSGKRTDVTIEVEGKDILAHRMILEMQSPVFAAMFSTYTKENQTGKVTIEDLDIGSVHAVLYYLYSGDIETLETCNVIALYAAAEKYEIKQVKDMCVKFMLRNLSVEWLCDIIKFINLYEVEEVRCRAREYFIEHSREILDSDKWKTFIKESPDIVCKFLG